MDSARFASVARTIALEAPALSAYEVLNLTELFVDLHNQFTVQDRDPKSALPGESEHDRLVRIALASPSVMGEVEETRKINAIKNLRALTNCGLKEAKEAVEDLRVWGRYNF